MFVRRRKERDFSRTRIQGYARSSLLAFGARGFKVSIVRRGMHRSLNPVTKKTLRAARVRMQQYFLSWTHFGPTKKRRVPSYERVAPSFKIKHGDLEREREREEGCPDAEIDATSM